MSQNQTFDNFAPRLKRGRIIPQGRRMIYETEDGSRQIVLPIEMADVILLSTGKYTMRQIIEKVFKRKGSIHFRTLFKTIHQLRDHGFLENGGELESYSWWTSPENLKKSWIVDRAILGRKTLLRPRTMQFYFLSLFTIAISFLTLLDMPWPPIHIHNFSMFGSMGLSILASFFTVSVLQTSQALWKAFFQLLLTGNMFGLYLRLTPWGFYLKTTDEPIFLITNRLFLMLYHAANLITPFLCLAPLRYVNGDYHDFAFAVASLKFLLDLSPFTASIFMQTMRSLLSLGQNDVVAGYLKEDSLLALLSPAGRPSFNRRLYRYFSVYVLAWSATATWLCMFGLHGTGYQLVNDPFAAMVGWVGFSCAVIWIMMSAGRHFRPIVKKPFVRLIIRARGLFRIFRTTEWGHQKVLDALNNLPLFQNFSASLLTMILQESVLRVAKPGSRLITQGEIGKDLFVLLEGSLLVEHSSFDQGRKQLSELQPITIFGEMAIIEESERSADVIASKSSTVLVVPSHILRVAAKESQYLREIEAFRNAITVNQFFTSAPMFKDLP